MRGEVIALDVETTGLDLSTDYIIEIGLARCQGDTILAQYQTFVRPKVAIPDRVREITGISDEDVAEAPAIADILEEVAEFIGDRPIIGHNIAFDIGALGRHIPLEKNPQIDTYELASVLLPTAPRYNLGSLANLLDLQLDQAHRALDDALAGWYLYRKLWAKLFELPLGVLNEINQLAEGRGWLAEAPFSEALAMRLEGGESLESSAKSVKSENWLSAFDPAKATPPLQPAISPLPLSIPALLEDWQPDGAVAKHIPNYELRPPQLNLLERVAENLNDSEHLVLHTPSGIGKTLAYMLPAIQWALTNGEAVVISTHSQPLQKQLITETIPFLQEQVGLNFRAALVQERAAYLCPRRLDTLRRRKPTHIDELRVLAKVLVWLAQGGDGLRGDLNLRGTVEPNIWHHLSAQDEHCTPSRCESECGGRCPLYHAHQASRNAHVLLARHDLIMADALDSNPILPPYQHLIIDETQYFEDDSTRANTLSYDKYSLLQRLDDLGGLEEGLLGDLLATLKAQASKGHYRGLKNYISLLMDAITQSKANLSLFFDEFSAFADRHNPSQSSDPNLTVRVTLETRALPDWVRIQKRWEALKTFLSALADSLSVMYRELGKLAAEADPNPYSPFLITLAATSSYLEQVQSDLQAFLYEPKARLAYWIGIQRGGDYAQVLLSSAPITFSKEFMQVLWNQKQSVTLIGSALRVDNQIKYRFIKERLGLDDFKSAMVLPPFDHSETTQILIAKDMPETNQFEDFASQSAQIIADLARMNNGRALVMFTGYTQLREMAGILADLLAEDDIEVYNPVSNPSNQTLMDDISSGAQKLMVGTLGNWEGVVLPADDINLLILPRLPFAIPNDPVTNMRIEYYGDDWFVLYSVPMGVMRLQQEVGRLVRQNQKQRVSIVLLDTRLTSKGYGRHFIGGLPTANIDRIASAHILKAVTNWLHPQEESAPDEASEA